jgi:hypothetical protein
VRSPRKLCAEYAHYAVQCWYRYWIEQLPGPVIEGPRDLLRLCHGLAGAQREGCIAGAEKDVYDTPVGQMAMCAELRAADARACVRGVANQAYAGEPRQELALLGDCRHLPRGAVGTCAAWLGQTFNVVENGRFLAHGCPLAAPALRGACAWGARRWQEPLVTFS